VKADSIWEWTSGVREGGDMGEVYSRELKVDSSPKDSRVEARREQMKETALRKITSIR
jgi:hypothetical protein